jgi:HAE1 family hydrophobic/amphiphilic exporter-1
MFLSDLSIKRPVVATVMMLALVTVGLFSFRRLPVDLMPEVEIPVLSIIAEYPGASPETVEREVSRKIEEAVNPIGGVKHVQSISREGLSSVVVEFNLEVKVNDVSQEARAKINAIRRELPETMRDPVIQKFDFNAMPIASLAVRSKTMPARELTDLADRKVKRRLESIAGVSKAKLIGSSKREVLVNLDPVRMAALGMGVNEVVAGLSSENVNTPLGRLTLGATEMPLRISGKPTDPAGYASMVIGRRGADPIRLSDVATISDTIEEQRSLALVNGEPAVAIDITKQTKANTVDVVDKLRAAVDTLRTELPPGTEIQIVRDSSVFIRQAVADVEDSLIIGGLLTVIIVFLFLNSWRSTVITGLTLPISVISAFIIMYFLGMTLNMLTLMALSLAIGLLIDDAIVVRENIVRHLEQGQDHFTAAREGTSEIGLAVLATSMSIIAVFIPVAFMKGIIGRFFFQFGMTVAFAVLVSLFVSFTLDPMLSSRWHDPDIERGGRRSWWHRPLDAFNDWFERMADWYKKVIGWALDYRKTVVLVALAAFVGGIGIFGTLQSEFQPPMDQGEFLLKMKSAPGASIAETRGRLEEVLRALAEFPEVRYTYGSIASGDADTVRDAAVFVKLSPKAERTRTTPQMRHDARLRLQQIPGVLLSVQEDPDAWQKPLQLAIKGDDIVTLKKYAAAIKRELYTVPGIVDIEAGMEDELPEYRLVVDRERAAASGLGSGEVAGMVATLVGGQAITTYEDSEGEAVNVRVRLPERLRGDIRQVADLKVSVPTMTGAALVPLTDLVTFTRATSPAEINRRDMSRQLVVDANLDGLPLGTAGTLSTEAASRVQLEPGYSLQLGGDTEMMVESFGYMAEALLLAVIFVYLILAAQFESFIDPLSIMLSLPLSIVGMAGMLFLTGDTINIKSLIGLIMLMGLVTKNAILLVDYTKVLRERGHERREALVLAGRTRLRPIMMTTAAMVFGMLPLFFGIGEGAEFRAPMARAVVGGLITSTILTLIVVPVVYTILDDVTAWLFRKKARPAAAALVLLLAGGLAAPAIAQERGTAPGPFSVAVATDAAVRAQSGAAQAQGAVPAAGTVPVLTLDRALKIALDQSPTIKKAVEFKAWVDGKYLEERAYALPQVSFSGAWMRQFDDSQSKLFEGIDFGGGGDGGDGGDGSGGDSGGMADFGEIFGGRQDIKSAEVKISQVVFTWGQVGAAIRAAKKGYDLAADQLRQAQQTVIRDVATAFFDVLVAQEGVAIAKEDLAQKERVLAETQKRQMAGTATDYDVLSSDVIVQNARPSVIRAENQVRQAKDRLRFLLAEPGVAEFTVQGSLEGAIDPAPEYAEVITRALTNRPELGQLASQKSIYGELVTIAKAGNKPRVDFAAGFGKRRLSLSTLGSTGTTWNAGIYLSVPLFDGWRTKGRVAQARSDLMQLTIDEQRSRDAVSVEVRLAVDAVRESAALLNAISGTVQQAEKLVFLAEKGFELGVKTNLEVQDAQFNLRAARANLARAQRDYRVARVALAWVEGTISAGGAF